MAPTRWLDEREARAWGAFQRMQNQLEARLGRELAATSQLSYADYVVLVVLTGEPLGRLRLGELADTLGWEKSRLSHHVGRMAGRGLVDKVSCPSDGRGVFVDVTAAGRAAIAAAAPGHVDAVRRYVIDVLSAEQLDALGAAADAVLAALDEH